MNRFAIRVLGGVGWTACLITVGSLVESYGITYDMFPNVGPYSVTIWLFTIPWGWLWVFREALIVNFRRHAAVGLFFLVLGSLTIISQFVVYKLTIDAARIGGGGGFGGGLGGFGGGSESVDMVITVPPPTLYQRWVDLTGIDGLVVFSALPLFAFGLALLMLSGQLSRLPNHALSSSPVCCPRCRYDLRGLREAKCPECGAEYTLEQLLQK